MVGMSQFADGGIIASNPMCQRRHIDRMSNYCASCAYKVKQKTGEGPVRSTALLAFLNRHRDRFEGNPRMGNMYRTWDRMDADKRDVILQEADALAKLEAGEKFSGSVHLRTCAIVSCPATVCERQRLVPFGQILGEFVGRACERSSYRAILA